MTEPDPTPAVEENPVANGSAQPALPSDPKPIQGKESVDKEEKKDGEDVKGAGEEKPPEGENGAKEKPVEEASKVEKVCTDKIETEPSGKKEAGETGKKEDESKGEKEIEEKNGGEVADMQVDDKKENEAAEDKKTGEAADMEVDGNTENKVEENKSEEATDMEVDGNKGKVDQKTAEEAKLETVDTKDAEAEGSGKKGDDTSGEVTGVKEDEKEKTVSVTENEKEDEKEKTVSVTENEKEEEKETDAIADKTKENEAKTVEEDKKEAKTEGKDKEKEAETEGNEKEKDVKSEDTVKENDMKEEKQEVDTQTPTTKGKRGPRGGGASSERKKGKAKIEEPKELSSPPLSAYALDRPVRERKTVERLVEVIEKEPNRSFVVEKVFLPLFYLTI